MIQRHPVVERYLTCLESAINEYEFPERQEITDEIRNHIAEATAAGQGLAAVLETLGPADVLARAYAVELGLNPRGRRDVGALGGSPGTVASVRMRRPWLPIRFLLAILAAGKRGGRSLGRRVRAIVAAALRGVWMLGGVLHASVVAGLRGVRRLAGLLQLILMAGARGVLAIGVFVKTAAAVSMRCARALGRLVTTIVAAAMRRVWTFAGLVKAAGVVAAASLAAAIVAVTVGVIGMGFTLSGAYLFVVGILEATGLPLREFQINSLAPVVAMTLGPMIMMAGGAALLLLRRYVQFLATVLRKRFPAAREVELARAV